MDTFANAASSPTAGGASPQALETLSPSYSLLLPFLAVVVWVIEQKRRAHASPEIITGRRLFRQLAPEMGSCMLVLGLATVLLVSRRDDPTPQEDEVWRDVKREWPLLMTADSLIGLQAMIRLVFLFSAFLRRSSAHASPFDGEPAALFMLAALSRVVLLLLSPRDVYHLDGPLGGDLNVAVEVTALLLLVPSGCRMLRKSSIRLLALALVVACLVGLSELNHFALAEGYGCLDQLFSLVVLLEIVAGFAFHVRSVWVRRGHALDAFTAFAHVILPMQQALPTYFLLVAFAAPFKVEPTLVGRGHPFELLQIGSLAQLGFYMFAALDSAGGTMELFGSRQVDAWVSSLATRVPAKEAPPADECVICLGSCGCAELGDRMPDWRRLKCGHQFHEACIFEWLRKSRNCPICRRHVHDTSASEWKGGHVSAGSVASAGFSLDQPMLEMVQSIGAAP